MKIDGARPYRATAGQRNVGTTEASEQGPQNQNRGTHRLHEFIRRKEIADGAAVDLDIHFFVDGQLQTHTTEEFHGRRDIVQMRYVSDHHGTVGQ